MSLQFVLGTAAADHPHIMVKQIRTDLDQGREVFYLVPNHIKFETEVTLLQRLRDQSGAYAQMQVQVLSFTRLAWYFLKNQAIYQKPRLDRASNTMLVAKLLGEMLQDDHQRQQLRLFAGSAGHAGFALQLADQLAELQTGRITAETLAAVTSVLPAEAPERQKFSELQLIMAAYEQAAAPYVTEPTLLAALADELGQRDLSHTSFYLNHFNDLSASEFYLVQTLLQAGAKVTVALLLDQAGAEQMPQPPALFLPAAKLYYRLRHAAQQSQAAMLPNVFAPKRQLSPALQAVDSFWQSETANGTGALKTPKAGLTLAKASEPYTELRAVAKQIVQAVHQGARYRDFLIIARHLDPYRPYLAPVFEEQKLPVFIDIEQPMQSHPVIALIESLFAIQQHHYQYEDMMRLLKTELLIPADMPVADFRAALDVLDNHLLRTGLTGSRWLDGQHWQYFRRQADDEGTTDDEKTTQINALKAFVAAQLPPLFDALNNATDGQAAAKALYDWLVQAGVPTRLATWRDEAVAAGDLSLATAGEQAWQTFVGLLDDYVAILGEAPFALDQFSDLLAAGFAGATYTQIPSTLDQVTVSETGLTRLSRYRHVFVIGATSTVMPDTPGDFPVLTASDRQVLADHLGPDAFLADSGTQAALGDPFLNYVAMMAGSESLTMSYPVYEADANNASPYLTQMQKRLHLPLTSWPAVSLATAVQEAAGSARSLLSDYVVVAREANAAKTPLTEKDAWGQVLAQIKTIPSLRDLAFRLEGATTHQGVGHLAPALASQLYSSHMNVSISQLERYYSNPFEYFLRYGLKLTKRPEFELTPADTGSLYHWVLDQLMRQLKAQGQALTALSDAQLQQTIAALVAQMAGEPGYEILTTSAHMRFVQAQITAMLTTNAAAIRGQQQRSAFRPQATEVVFGRIGQHDGLKGLVLPLDAQHQITVSGRIDRLDTATIAGTPYFVVVDYKSSAHDFDPLAAYYGKAMQLLTYIDAVANAESMAGLKPAGAQYFRFHQPRLKYEKTTDLPLDLLKDFKMAGLLVLPDDEAAATALTAAFDQSLAAGENSALVALGLKKDGSLTKERAGKLSKRLSPAGLQLMVQHNRHLIVQAAQQIMAGNIDLAPLQFKQESTVITNSDYQSIMLFDPATGFDRYHHVAPLDQATLEQKLRKEAEGSKGDE